MLKKKSQTNSGALLNVHNPGLKLLNYTVALIWATIIIVPLIMVFFMSFKTSKEVGFSGVFEPPESFLNFENYVWFAERSKIFMAFKNTFILILASVPVSLLLAAMASYVLDRFRYRGRKLVSALFSGAVLIPNITTQVVKFTMIMKLGIYNTRLAGVVLFTAADIVQIYLFRQFIKNVP